jgi:SOS-response transcriptional repressor LexA
MVRKPTASEVFVRWLNAGLAKPGKSNSELGRKLGIPQSRISEMRKAVRQPKATELRTIAEYLEEDLPAELVPAGPVITTVPVLALVSAGKLDDNGCEGEVLRHIALGGLDAKGDWFAFIVQGDSMDRISPPGSVIIMDRKDRRLVPNGCYVVADAQGNAAYKRYRPAPDRFEPVSTNPTHEPIFPKNDITVIGRVRRTLLEM